MEHPIIPLLWKEFKLNVSNPLAFLVHLLNPTLYIVLFAASIAANFQYISYQGRAVNYMNFLIPGMLAYYTLSTFTLIFSFIRIDMTSNIIIVIMMSKAKIRDYFLAKLLFYVLLSFFLASYFMVLGWIFGNYFPQSLFNLLTLYIILFLGIIFWFSLGFICGLRIKTPYMRDIILTFITLPTTFTSSAYYNLDVAPLWVRLIGSVNPLTFISNLLRLSYFDLDIQKGILEIIGLAIYTSITLAFALMGAKKLTIK